MVEGLRIAREVGGGELGRLLRNLSGYLRDEARTRSEMESRQAWSVNGARLAVAAPWVVLLFMSFQSEVIERYASPGGVAVLVGGGAGLRRRLPADDADRPAADRTADPVMTRLAGWWGALLGLTAGGGVLLVWSRVAAIRRPQLALRVLPYVRDLPEFAARPARPAATQGVFGPVLQVAADTVERVLGGAASVRRRLERAGIDQTVHEFRVNQVVWGLVGFALTAAYGVLQSLSGGGSLVSSGVLCLVGFSLGVIGRDYHLSGQVRDRERRILLEFPAVAELLALAVAAGEGPVAALDRVVRRSGGELSRELARVLADVRTGEPVGDAFDQWAARSGQPLVARFAQGIAVAVERGTPLADVLHAQAADVREAGRRELIETAARKEVFMMVPVVFLVLPVTVFFAFWPGVVGLSLTTP